MGMVTLPGQMVWDLVTVKKEMWSEENMMIPIEDKNGKVIDQSSTMGFSVFGNREAIHRYEGIWVLRKKQLETATASLVERKWCVARARRGGGTGRESSRARFDAPVDGRALTARGAANPQVHSVASDAIDAEVGPGRPGRAVLHGDRHAVRGDGPPKGRG